LCSILNIDFGEREKMPHTNRKKKSTAVGEKKTTPKLVHTKRQQIEDDDGWTHVIDTPRKSQVKVKEGQLHAGDFERAGVAYVERTIEEMKTDLEYYTKQWEGTEACAGLKEKLVGEGRVKIGDVVCLGLGSLQSARREGRRSSFTQLAALRTIVETLCRSAIFPRGMFKLIRLQQVERSVNASFRIPNLRTSTRNSSSLSDTRWLMTPWRLGI
jgi:hypothetical protein